MNAAKKRRRVLYVDKHGQVPFRFVSLLSFGRFGLLWTWGAKR